MPFVVADDGILLYYESVGEGVPVVFVHEFAGSFSSWRDQVNALRNVSQTIVYNCRGYPPSSVPDELSKYSQQRSICDLGNLLDQLNITRTILVGLSMGGNIVLNFALQQPENVISAVVAGTGSGSEDPEPFARRFEDIASRMKRMGLAAVADEYLTGPTRIQLKRKSPHKWERQREEFCRLSDVGLANTIRGAIVSRPPIYALGDKLRGTSVPIIVVVGDQDAPTIEPSKFIAANARFGRLEVFSNTGHVLNLEEPERFNSLIRTEVLVARAGKGR